MANLNQLTGTVVAPVGTNLEFGSITLMEILKEATTLTAEKGYRNMKKRLGLVARSDNTGLGYQSKALADMLKPDKVLLIDSTPFKEIAQHPEWYKDYDVITSDGIPGFREYENFLNGVDVMLTAETPYCYEAWNWCKIAGIKSFCQPNWELFDGLVQHNMPHPYQYLIPSYWHLKEFEEQFNGIYLPPPTITEDFAKAREANLKRTGKKRFVHIAGNMAIYDRNGWAGLRDALAETNADFELVVYSQTEITGIVDDRIKYHIYDIENREELYTNFDALILPRRYGGLCLPMNEALTAGLPVIMPDISPNNQVLPQKWLLEAYESASFEGRSHIEVYSVRGLGQKIEDICNLSDEAMVAWKNEAIDIAYNNYSPEVLRSRYETILSE